MSVIAPCLEEVVSVLESIYPLDLAEDWDRVGLVLGVDGEQVSRILLAVDPTVAVAADAADFDLLITHHPLLLRGESALPASTGKGRVVTSLLRAGTALWTGHTNADRAESGTATALSRALALRDTRPLIAPASAAPRLHGMGMVGELREATTVGGLCQDVLGVLPATVQGAKHTGPAEREVRRVAICPGAGDAFLDLASDLEADVYITSDLRHHAALEHLESRADPDAVPALIDVPHWAAESLWLPLLAEELRAVAEVRGWDLEVRISQRRTDPWTGSRTA